MDQHLVAALIAGLLITALLASVWDWRQQRIPNGLLLASLAYALAILALVALQAPDWRAVLRVFTFPLVGMSLCGVVLFPPYRWRQVAAGDLKLAMVFGFYLGPLGGMVAILNGALVGGIWALWLAWRHGGLGNAWRNMKLMAESAYVSGFKELGWDLRRAEAVVMPYGVALSTGAASVGIWQLWLRLAEL